MIPKFVKEREEQGLGFDLYFAGSANKVAEPWMLEHKVCRLQSQLNERKNIMRWVTEAPGGKLLVDSGAYTALTQGAEVDVDDYIKFINGISEGVHAFAQVDYIPKSSTDKTDTAEASWQNYLYMYDKVKEPDKLIPIYHQSESLSALKRMVEHIRPDGTHIPYIGFGALAGTGVTVPQKMEFFHKCYKVILQSSNPDVKVHAMGMTSLSLLEMFPFYSADSTSWLMQAATGSIMTPWGMIDVSTKNKFVKSSLFHAHPEAYSKVEQWLTDNNLTIEAITSDYTARFICNLTYLSEWAKNYRYKGGNLIFKKSLF